GIPGRTVAAATPQGTREIDAVLRLESDSNISQLGIALAVLADPVFKRDGETLAYVAEGAPGRHVKVRTIAAMVSRYYHPSPDLQAIRMASWGRMLGFERLRQQNREEWSALWK